MNNKLKMTNKFYDKKNKKYSFILQKITRHYEVPAQKIVFTPDSLFTKKFLEDLNRILNLNNNGNSFKKMKNNEKIKVVKELEELLQTETRWKDLVKRSKFNTTKIKEIFPIETEEFKNLYSETFLVQPEDLTNRRKEIRGSAKVKKFIKAALIFLKEQHNSILTEKGKFFEYTEIQLESIIKEISALMLFQDIIKICMKKAYDANVNIEQNNPYNFRNTPLNTNFLRAKQTDLIYPIFNYLNVFLTSLLLNDLADRSLLVDNKIDYIIETLKLLEKRYKTLIKTDYKNNIWLLNTSEIAHILLDILEGTSVIKETILDQSHSRKNKIKSHKIYVFDHKLDNSISFSKHLPRITPPRRAELNSTVENWVAPMKKGGTSNIQISDNALTSLNNAHRKNFEINRRFLELLKQVDNTRDKVEEFPTKQEFFKTQDAYVEWSNSAWNNLLDLEFYRTTKSILYLNKKQRNNLHFKTINLCGISNLECLANFAKNQIRVDLLVKKQMRQLLLTSVDIGEIFKDYPLYYGTRLDFRLRMYPLQYLMSRTSGFLKNLLQEGKSRFLTSKGLKNMLQAYYAPDPILLEKFKDKNLKNRKTLFAFFAKNKINLNDNPLYFELLERELLHLSTTSERKTALMLEVDQVGSGPAFVAILTKNKALAKKCNLLQGDFCCIYTYLLQETKNFFKSNDCFDLGVKTQKSKAFKLLTTKRKAQKYSLMCFFYNEQHLSRTKRWKQQFEEEYGISPSDEEFKILQTFSLQYEKFMNLCFPKLISQLNILNEVMLINVKQALPIKINTLDKCILSWDYENSIEIKKNYYNPVSGSHDQFRLRVNTDEIVTDRTRLQRHRLSFRPNFIHSIDGSIMRIFLQKYYEITKRRLNHLHDCIMVHPNDVSIFYEIVREVYCDPKMNTLAKDLFFARMKIDLTGDPLEKVKKLEEKFYENMDEFDLNLNVFDPKKCYRYEGTK